MTINGTQLDWLSLVIVILSSCILLTYGWCLFIYRKYAALKAKDIPNLVLMIIASVIHIWSTFIVNEHGEPFKTIHNDNCILWTFVFQFSFGLGLWISCVFYRVAKFGNLFQYEASKKRLVKFIGDILACLGLIPILFITMCVWFADGCYFNDKEDTCNTGLVWKIVVATWLGIVYWVFIVTVIVMIRRINNTFFNESKQLTGIIILALVVMCLNTAIVFSDNLDTVIGRNIFTISVCLLDLISTFLLSGKTIIAAMGQDIEYLAKYKSSLIPSVLPSQFTNMEEVFKNDEFYFDFIRFCRDQKINEEITEDKIICGRKVTQVIISNITACITAIDQYRIESLTPSGPPLALYEAIVKRICSDDNSGFSIPNQIKETILKNEKNPNAKSLEIVKDYLLSQLSLIFGNEYMQVRLPDLLKEDKNKVQILTQMESIGLITTQEEMALLRSVS